MVDTTTFEERYGFRRDEVTLANWRLDPYGRWSFQNVGELVPSAHVWRGTGAEDAPAAETSALVAERVRLANGEERIADFLARSYADALVVMKGGHFVADWFAPSMDFGNRHITFSISKSITAVVAGALQERGLLDPGAPVVQYVPEAEGSAYGDATVQHVLDMTVAIDIDEAYLDPQSPFGRYRRAMLWNPGGGEEGLREFLCSLRRLPGDHGEIFRYRSPNTDMLGIILERASGLRMADLLREIIWAPLGARGEVTMTVDREGTSRASAGISLTPRDLARFGEMMRQGGTANGTRVVSEAWVSGTLSGGSKAAWDRSDFAPLFPKGRYHNKWYQTGEGSFCGIGIHGQWLYIDPAADVVIVRMSSQPDPIMEGFDRDNLALLGQLARMV
ncbi:serine hydrolase [Rhizobium lusitanum]|uniref:Serine hydrolase n=1 Tax=Rhizobium lusitanum TaxID=293958 RepID=A0A6L9U6U9_9HYPH|nr:serine hydrolase [Rhizobium lusitanum]NEI71635.1 serine hydrolase [Rhizobium lusitanum]